MYIGLLYTQIYCKRHTLTHTHVYIITKLTNALEKAKVSLYTLRLAQRALPVLRPSTHVALPVSYTHLDVYKRQPYNIITITLNI